MVGGPLVTSRILFSLEWSPASPAGPFTSPGAPLGPRGPGGPRGPQGAPGDLNGPVGDAGDHLRLKRIRDVTGGPLKRGKSGGWGLLLSSGFSRGPSGAPLACCGPSGPLGPPPLPAAAWTAQQQQQQQQQRWSAGESHVREGAPLAGGGGPGVGPLRGAPQFRPRVRNLEINFLEIDPDNPTRLLEYFSDLLKRGDLEPSEPQKTLMQQLQVLSSLASLWGRLSSPQKTEPGADAAAAAAAAPETLNPRIRGLYIWGGVGQGKTMILNAFFDCLAIKNKQRVHFHQFMLDVQQELHQIKQQQPPVGDPLMEVARKIRQSAKVLCFDEFQLGVVVVATSNRPPSELYLGGLNRERFLPFIPLLEKFCKVYHIDTKKDYRQAKGGVSCRRLFYAPPRPENEIFDQLQKAAGGPLEKGEIQVGSGRSLEVPRMRAGFAAFSFEDLCCSNVGAADYFSLSFSFHTLSIRSIPDLHQMDLFPNEIRRFISLIDVLYERSTRVLFDAEAPLFRLLGIPKAAKRVEQIRQQIQNKFHRLDDALLALSQFSENKESFSSEEWRAAATAVLGLSASNADEAFSIMTSRGTFPLDSNRIRAILFFHMTSFDFEAPTTADLFLFSSEKEAAQVLQSPAVYELNNEGLESAGSQDNQFSFVRTISRIRDMTSLPYLRAHQKAHKLNDLAVLGIIEK
ncbi:ATPase, AFG1 family domain-containing protein, putative [Eimeria tenella]|uniref:ATPase, AFG1 family domain-containing protein, putative n=1 Tax=Eimeria tenella TaxID=5802 RepID=U6L1G9_EIMTE|nr:ATPase, AFG1 family domain-containing protein, putative [Eimeria tenella]CDJ42419.1 ATPase, AFG1 family domain-containing protein, putative [Eimeria tenella]|eukprot:XP_013233169.1 ATPase, AFG1 family domain-containing protein, putative [Eimeria tenella]